MTLQFARYVLVGVVALVLDVLCFVVLRSIGLPVHWANGASRLLGAVTAFVGNSIWTFKSQQRTSLQWRSAWRYGVLWLVATALSTVLLMLLVPLAPEPLVKLGLEVSMVLLNFAVSRYWVYVSK